MCLLPIELVHLILELVLVILIHTWMWFEVIAHLLILVILVLVRHVWHLILVGHGILPTKLIVRHRIASLKLLRLLRI